MIDEHTREALAIDVAGSIRSERVIEVLSRLISERGAPKALRSDNGPEFVSTRLLQWATYEGLQMALSQPGKPWQNGADESFNGKVRNECLRNYQLHLVDQGIHRSGLAPCGDPRTKALLRFGGSGGWSPRWPKAVACTHT